ncbi:MAG: hypothetical protein ACK2UW_11180, partial [Anaerolineales bacterium]
GAQRLRPVMLTTITTMLGLMPLMFGVNIDFIARHVSVGAPATQWWSQLAFHRRDWSPLDTNVGLRCAAPGKAAWSQT